MESQNSSNKEDVLYEIENIRARRSRRGQIEYCIKWLGYPEKENTWEPASNVPPEVIAEFERKREMNKNKRYSRNAQKRKAKKDDQVSSKKTISDVSSRSSKKPKCEWDDQVDAPVGFARRLEPAKIIGARKVNDQLRFIISWVGSDDIDEILAKEANEKCPQHVIDFYEERLDWCTNDA